MAGERTEVKLKACVVGDEAVGKTSLIRRFVQRAFDEHYVMTIGTAVSKKTIELPAEGLTVLLQVWDIMGRKDFIETFKDVYSKQTGGIVAVFDLTRSRTLDSLYEWMKAVGSSSAAIPTVVLGNKSDLTDMVDVPDAAIERFCDMQGCSWLKTSAKTGENVEEAFRRLAREMVKGHQQPPSP